MTTINTNLAALAAQNALRSANSAVQKLVQRLSTGERIIDPADDAAGLAIGTVLKTRASTLRAAFTSAAQANSLLSVADGAAKNIGDILKRAKDLSVQANSGSITDAERSFLNQEFQNLLAEVDATAKTTKFNTTKLLDGSISGSNALKQNTFSATSTTFGTAQTLFTASSTAPTDGQTILINGATITFTTDATRQDRVLVGGNETVTARNLAAFLNTSSDSRISPFSYTSAAAVVSITFAGGFVAGDITNYVDGADGTYTAGTPAAVTFVTTNSIDGLGEGRISYSGTTNDSVILDITRGGFLGFSAATNGGIRNNTSFIGNISASSSFTAQFLGADSVVLSIKVGDKTYTSATIADTTPAADTTVLFTGRNADGTTTDAGAFSITLRASNGTTVASQANADTYASRFTDALSGVTFYQNRDVTSYVASGDIVTNGIVTGTLLGSSFDLTLSDFSNANISDIKVSAPGVGQDSGVIEFVINGKTFRSRSDIGSSLTTSSYYVFSNVDNPKETIGFATGATAITGTTAIKFTNAAEATSLVGALKSAFGLGAGSTGLTFQVGTDSTDTIDVKLGGLTLANLGLTGASISTSLGAQDASARTDAAITALNSGRANIGALQSRFNFKQATLSSSIQNTEAAASLILDANIAEESTNFAAKQVQVLAGISVLAQANQLPQNLLKLIG